MTIRLVRKTPQVLSERDSCPKCGGFAWYEVTNIDIIQRCLCGLYRYVWARTSDGGFRQHTQKKAEFKMPDPGTKLARCLGFVASIYPGTATTKQLCWESKQSVSDVSSQLIVLMHKGLVERVVARPGASGGSVWRVTRRAVEALKLKEV